MSNRFLHRAGRLAAGLALAVGAAVARAADPLPEKGIGLPRDVSVDGHLIDSLLKITTLFVSLLFLAMVTWMLIAVFRHGRNHKAVYEKGDSKRAMFMAFGLAGAIFCVVDGNLLVNALIDVNETFWNFKGAAEQPGALLIEVNAHQWAWDFRNPGPDGAFNTADDIVTMHELTVPAGVPIVLQLASTDVIHSFYLPNFRIKSDAVPGQVNSMRFEARPDIRGDFEIGCAQHCGANHYKMRAILHVLSKEDYDAWYARATQQGKRGFDPADALAHWGWAWRKS